MNASENLVKMLQEAAKLEHSLLNSYLFAACSLKSMPFEFRTLDNGRQNQRRALHFEKARRWKQSILSVAHEEMLHLHYVQCMLRALGASPFFALPDLDATGSWIIPNWDINRGDPGATAGTTVPVETFSPDLLKQFLLFESTDSLQDANPFSDTILALFRQLSNFELDLHLESILLGVTDDSKREWLKSKLKHIYTELLPDQQEAELDTVPADAQMAEVLEDFKYVRFQSIGEFYRKGILPLYEQAFDEGQVVNSNLAFNNEILGPKAAEGFLPIGPVYRSKNFTDYSKANASNPLRHFKSVKNIIEEIIQEGEGFANFEKMAMTLLAKVKDLGGARPYLDKCNADRKERRNPKYTSPDWLANAELCRQSHLYKFAMIYVDMEMEERLARDAGVAFSLSRKPAQPDRDPAFRKLLIDLPKQFNACYLVMLIWLSRIYEIKEWESDRDRRYAIEMIATWPLMSLAIRPFLELASFFPIDPKQLFRFDKDSLPALPTHARQLTSYFQTSDRSESINKAIDYLAMHTLTDAADWAKEQIDAVGSTMSEPEVKNMIVTRLKALSQLTEFEKQFPFREHGGYSNQLPDRSFQQQFPDASDFSEDPSQLKAIFENCLVLKLRFSGFGLVQLATDPDPPSDEVGCSGTHMLHMADGNGKFDRALVWQTDSTSIVRGPSGGTLPPIGVNLVDATLQITNKTANAGYVPTQIMRSVGAVQTDGIQQDLQISGLIDLLRLLPKEISPGEVPIKVNLLEKDGVKAYLYGDNHLVSKDGEPIDPFIISITDASSLNIFQREIFNNGKDMREMSPLQRLNTARWPTGFEPGVGSMPTWVKDSLPRSYTDLVFDEKFPLSYLDNRTATLSAELDHLLASNSRDEKAIDDIASTAERLLLVTIPRSTTVAWLTFLLNYGHSVSGPIKSNETDNLFYKAIESALNIKVTCDFKEDDREKPNSRWVMKYTKGIMDTDALTDLVYGELYIPLKLIPNGRPFSISKEWKFAAGMRGVLGPYACDFTKPFWAQYQISDRVRTVTLADGLQLNETLIEQQEHSYTYSLEGVTGISQYKGSFHLVELPNAIALKWESTFEYTSAESFLQMTTTIGQFIESITAALQSHFSPK